MELTSRLVEVPMVVVDCTTDAPEATASVTLDAQRLIEGEAACYVTVTYADGSSRRYHGHGSWHPHGDGPPDRPHPELEPLWNLDLEAWNTGPWYEAVADHRPVEPGEHPRLLFREEDIPALRERAKTEAGQAIIARLRKLLGHGGEELPTSFNPTPPHNHNKSPDDLPIGETFTSRGRTITEADIHQFAQFTGDWNPVHVDETGMQAVMRYTAHADGFEEERLFDVRFVPLVSGERR